MKPPKIAVFCRVSSSQQESEDTIERQYEDAKNFFANRKILIQDGGEYEFLPRYPGGKLTPKNFFADEAFNLETWDPKTAFSDLMIRIENREIQAIFISEANRLFRSRSRVLRAQILDLLERFNVRIFNKSGEIPKGLLLEVSSSFGAEDKRANLIKCHDGKRLKIKEGRPPSGRSCFGLNWDNRRREWSVEEPEAQVIRWVAKAGLGKISDGMPFHLRTAAAGSPDGLSDRLISEALQKDGANLKAFFERTLMNHQKKMNPEGTINETFVRNLFRDDRYVGQYPVYLKKTDQVGLVEFQKLSREEKELFIIEVPRILQNDLEWKRVKDLRRHRLRKKNPNVVHEYTFEDLIQCSVCGNLLAALSRAYETAEGAVEYSKYYVCRRKPKVSGYRCPATKCHNENALEPFIMGQITRVVLDPKTITAVEASSQQFEITTPIEALEKQVTFLRKEILALEEKRQKINDLVLDGFYSRDEGLTQRNRIDGHRKEKLEAQERIRGQIDLQRKAEEDARPVRMRSVQKKYASHLNMLSFEEKRDLLRTLVHRIIVGPEGQIKIKLRPLLTK